MDRLYESSVFYGLSLVITTTIHTLQKKLDFYHTIVVMQIIFYLDLIYACGAGFIHSGNTLTVPTKYDYAGIRRSLRRLGKTLRIILLVGIQNFSTMVFTVWLLHELAHDDHFVSQPDCNQSVKYVFFFVSVRATSTRLQILFVAAVIIAALSFLFKFVTIVREVFSDLLSDEIQTVLVGNQSTQIF